MAFLFLSALTCNRILKIILIYTIIVVWNLGLTMHDINKINVYQSVFTKHLYQITYYWTICVAIYDNFKLKTTLCSLDLYITYFEPFNRHIIQFKFSPTWSCIVSRWRDPQLQVSENYSDLTKWSPTVFKHCWLMSHFIFNMFKRRYLMC